MKVIAEMKMKSDTEQKDEIGVAVAAKIMFT